MDSILAPGVYFQTGGLKELVALKNEGGDEGRKMGNASRNAYLSEFRENL
jgi:hypothetical protein